jgi:hypothetical protein
MLFSSNDYLRVVTPYLPHALISPEVLLCISRIAHDLPPTSLIGFESRLASPAPTVDFAVGITAASGSREVFAGGKTGVDLPAPRSADRAWQRFHTFAAQCADPASRFHDEVSTVWLEWDVDAAAERAPVPNVLFGIKAKDPQSLAEIGLHCLMSRPLSPPIRDKLAQCFAALPPQSHIFQVGVMLARHIDGVRVCVYPVQVEQIGEYLAQIGWTGPANVVADVLGPFCAFATNIALDVDVGERVSPKIGIECYLDDRRRARVEPGWMAFLDHLVAQGMCTAAKRDALLAWPGTQHTSQFIWPSIFIRGLNHIKLVYQPGRPLEAKAYWGFAQHWSSTPARMGAASLEKLSTPDHRSVQRL